MQHTTNYNLNQWEADDVVRREDVNADNAKIDAALATCGNCQVVYGSYIGAGGNGSDTRRTLTFDHRPVFLFVRRSLMSEYDEKLLIVRGVTETNTFRFDTAYKVDIVWGERSVYWTSGSGQYVRMDEKNEIYYYVALLDMEH